MLLEIFLCFLVEFFFFVFLLGCCITVAYSTRFVYFLFPFFYGGRGVFQEEERNFYFYSSFFLFMFCCFSGVLFFWLFLSESSRFFRLFDYLEGLFIFLTFFGFFLVEKIFLSFYNFFSFLGFLKFISSRVFSRNFNKFFYWLFDFSWFEILGGGGFYNFFRFLGFSVNNVISFGFKWGILIGIPFIIWM